MNLLKKRLDSFFLIEIAFFLYIVGNSSLLNDYGLGSPIEYIGELLLLLYITYRMIQANIKIFDISIFVLCSYLFSIGIISQSLPFHTKFSLIISMVFIVMLAVFGKYSFDNPYYLISISKGLVYGLLFVFILGIVGGVSFQSLVAEDGLSSIGFNGGMEHKNYFAISIYCCILLTIVFRCFIKKSIITPKHLFLLLIGLFFIIISSSRTVLILIALSYSIYILKYYSNYSSYQRAGLLIIFAGFIILIGIVFYYSYAIRSSTYGIRFRGLINYLNLYGNNPSIMWFGNAELGFSNPKIDYATAVRSVIGWDGTVELSLLSILIKTGLLGLVAYILILSRFIFMGLKAKSWLYKIAISMLIYPLICSAFVENYIANIHIVYMPVTFCAIWIVYNYNISTEGNRD